jgi:hypothetical protein
VEGSCCRNGDARRSDPYGHRGDRIAYVAFAASLNKTDGRKAAQEKGREVAHTDEDAHEAASAGWMLLVNRGMTVFGVS